MQGRGYFWAKILRKHSARQCQRMDGDAVRVEVVLDICIY